MTTEPFQYGPSGLIEFDPVELDPVGANAPAPTPVDSTIDADPLSINFTRKKDHKPSATERMLAGTTIDWLVAFPADARPKALCDRFPHVANRLANGWSDRALSLRSLQVLASDARWGRVGFPVQVQGELQRLLERLTGAKRPG